MGSWARLSTSSAFQFLPVGRVGENRCPGELKGKFKSKIMFFFTCVWKLSRQSWWWRKKESRGKAPRQLVATLGHQLPHNFHFLEAKLGSQRGFQKQRVWSATSYFLCYKTSFNRYAVINPPSKVRGWNTEPPWRSSTPTQPPPVCAIRLLRRSKVTNPNYGIFSSSHI